MAEPVHGGYDCEFVEKPPDPVQSECPVCLLIVRSPYQSTCCGYGFCQTCIERVKLRNGPCPCCKAKEFDSYPDIRLRRMLSGYRVYCTHVSQGCEWKGGLGQLENHLNSNPPQDMKLVGCQFVLVSCHHCSELVQRSSIEDHASKDCPKRPFSCEYCCDFCSNYEDVTVNHWPVCGYYLVSCPAGCGLSIERRNLDSHVMNTCKFKKVECQFAEVGCKVKLPRKDMPAHLTDNLAQHMTLLLLNQAKLQAENKQLKERCDTLEAEKREIKEKVFTQLDKKYKELVSRLDDQEQSNTEALSKSSIASAEISHEIDNMKHKMHALQVAQVRNESKKQQRFGTPIRSVDFTMYTFDYYKKYNKQWFSPPFYTHPYGYKMCLSVDANGWGIGTKRTYAAIYVYLMKGEFDDELKWPFQGDITVELINQEGGSGHTKTVSFMEMAFHGVRVSKGSRALSGPGVTEFVSHSDLQPRYLRNGSLQFRISKVEFNY